MGSRGATGRGQTPQSARRAQAVQFSPCRTPLPYSTPLWTQGEPARAERTPHDPARDGDAAAEPQEHQQQPPRTGHPQLHAAPGSAPRLCARTQLRLGSRLNSWLLAALKS